MSEQSVMVRLVKEPISIAEAREFACGNPNLGGIATFEGATRAEVDPLHGQLIHLDYEAYDAMALREMEILAKTAVERWGAGRVAIFHRLGRIVPGEISVLIMVACPHRAEAFEACRWIIDTLKKDVPIWKKDVFVDGHTRWVEPNASKN